MRLKLNNSIAKLVQTEINPFQAAMCYNAFMTKSVHFGCGIVELTKEQNQELKRTHEALLLIKLGLSQLFPRSALYSHKSALGAGIMTPQTIINALKAKSYLGNIRQREKFSMLQSFKKSVCKSKQDKMFRWGMILRPHTGVEHG